MLFLVFLSTLLSISLSAPTCDPNTFCYTPDDFTKVTITRAGDFLNLKIWDEKSVVRIVHLVQKNGQEVLVNCGSDSTVVQKNDGVSTCQAQLQLSQFDKESPVSLKLSDAQISEPFLLDSMLPPPQEALTKQQRRQFSKAHAILMIIGWLFFVPTGFMFARLGREFFKGQLLFGTAVWFQVHRAANFMGVVCICSSILCIFISTQWKWKGTGSGSKYWTEVHTDLGIISTVLAVAQPINSLFRCGPGHSQRFIFNWAHRIVGVIAYSLALTAIIIAAVQFKRIWSEPLLELVLVSLPIVICIAASVVFGVLENERFRSKSSFGEVRTRTRLLKIRRARDNSAEEEDSTPLVTDTDFDENAKPVAGVPTDHILRQPVVFWATGVFFCIAVALSLLVVNGYKNV